MLAVAKNALQMGMTLDDIIKLTGLSADEMEALKRGCHVKIVKPQGSALTQATLAGLVANETPHPGLLFEKSLTHRPKEKTLSKNQNRAFARFYVKVLFKLFQKFAGFGVSLATRPASVACVRAEPHVH